MSDFDFSSPAPVQPSGQRRRVFGPVAIAFGCTAIFACTMLVVVGGGTVIYLLTRKPAQGAVAVIRTPAADQGADAMPKRPAPEQRLSPDVREMVKAQVAYRLAMIRQEATIDEALFWGGKHGLSPASAEGRSLLQRAISINNENLKRWGKKLKPLAELDQTEATRLNDIRNKTRELVSKNLAEDFRALELERDRILEDIKTEFPLPKPKASGEFNQNTEAGRREYKEYELKRDAEIEVVRASRHVAFLRRLGDEHSTVLATKWAKSSREKNRAAIEKMLARR